jgi:two-component system response regulator PilR (NtrC family)
LLRRLSRRLGGEAPELGADALAALQGYGFPGNVRELENILERALTLCTGDVIGVADLQLRAAPAGTAAEANAASIVKAAAAGAGSSGSDLGDQLEHIERDAILKALEQTRYNKTAAARLLGITFRALRYKVKKLGIE